MSKKIDEDEISHCFHADGRTWMWAIDDNKDFGAKLNHAYGMVHQCCDEFDDGDMEDITKMFNCSGFNDDEIDIVMKKAKKKNGE